MVGMSDHSVLAPSSAEIMVACPGSVGLRIPYPSAETDATREGTAAHWAALHLAMTGEIPDPVAPNGVPVTPDMLDYAEQFVALVDATARGMRHYEEVVQIPAVHDEAWGTPDVAATDPVNRVIRLYDYKYGHRYVDAYRNWQLVAYLSGLFSMTDGDASWRFEATIYQPRSFHADGPVRVWKLGVPELSELVRELRNAAEEALGPNPTTHAGPHCRDCTARHVCTTLQDAAAHIADRAGDPVPLELLGDQLGRELTWLTRAAAVINSRILGLTSQADTLIATGSAVEGWRIEHSKGRESWTRSVAEVVLLGRLFHLNLEKPTELISPAQARKLGVPEIVVGTVVTRRPGSASLVPATTHDAQKALAT